MDKVLAAGYDGIEIFLPPQANPFTAPFLKRLDGLRSENPGFVFIAQQLTAPENDSVDAYISRMEKSLMELAAYRPSFINSHTGKDYFCRTLRVQTNAFFRTT